MNSQSTGGPRSPAWTILGVLDATRGWFTQRGIESARLDAEILIAHALGIPRVMLYARFDQPLSDEERAKIRALVSRRGKNEPIAYITGEREFWSLPLSVDARVLVPRPDTEVLVEVALEHMRSLTAPRILDVGTGSGAIALALAHDLPAAIVLGVDISEGALEVARSNAARNALSVTFSAGDLLRGLSGPFDLVVANLPYVRAADIASLAPDVRAFEPHLALDGGVDGLDLVRRLVDEAATVLAPDGVIALEAGFDQLDEVAGILSARNYRGVAVRNDYGGNPRVASATAPLRG